MSCFHCQDYRPSIPVGAFRAECLWANYRIEPFYFCQKWAVLLAQCFWTTRIVSTYRTVWCFSPSLPDFEQMFCFSRNQWSLQPYRYTPFMSIFLDILCGFRMGHLRDIRQIGSVNYAGWPAIWSCILWGVKLLWTEDMVSLSGAPGSSNSGLIDPSKWDR